VGDLHTVNLILIKIKNFLEAKKIKNPGYSKLQYESSVFYIQPFLVTNNQYLEMITTNTISE